MSMGADEQPKEPRGTWIAAGRESLEDSGPYEMETTQIRFMWDYTVSIPLWGVGLLPEDDDWLHNYLGLDHALIIDLRRWGADMNTQDGQDAPQSPGDWLEPWRELDQRARALVERLLSQIGDRYDIEYVPWVKV